LQYVGVALGQAQFFLSQNNLSNKCSALIKLEGCIAKYVLTQRADEDL